MLSQYQALSARCWPISSSMKAFAASMPASKRFMWPTCSTLPERASTGRRLSTSSTETPSGFSQRTCLPASSAMAAALTWKPSEVAMITASSAGSASISA